MSAFQSSQHSVGSVSAVQLVSGLTGRYQVVIQNTASGAGNAVYLGNSSAVTTATGFQIWNQSSDPNMVAMDVLLDSTDELWAISGTNTVDVFVMVNPR